MLPWTTDETCGLSAPCIDEAHGLSTPSGLSQRRFRFVRIVSQTTWWLSAVEVTLLPRNKVYRTFDHFHLCHVQSSYDRRGCIHESFYQV